MKKIIDKLLGVRNSVVEVKEEIKELKPKLSIDQRLDIIENNINELTKALTDLTRAQIEGQETLVQLATATEEMVYIFDSKSILVNIDPKILALASQEREEASSMGGVMDLKVNSSRKKVMN